jgi:hypothetical protein
MVVIESSWINNHLLYLQSVPITTNVVSSNLVQVRCIIVYNHMIIYYVNVCNSPMRFGF